MTTESSAVRTIANSKLLEILAAQSPVSGREWWVSALLRMDLIPLTPGILTGLHRAFPKVKKEAYIHVDT